MKKSLLILLLVSTAWANAPYDTSTTGNLKLLKPSLTTADPNRNWGSKFNANFDIIDSSLTGVMTQITGLSTTTAVNIRNSTGTWTAAQSFSSGTYSSTLTVTGQSLSIGGIDYIWQSTAPESGNNILQRSGSRLLWGGDGGGGGGGGGGSTQAGSTMTYVLNVNTVFLSTIEPCGLGACYSMGQDTGTIVGYWVDAVKASTVGFTGIRFAVSTGGISGLPIQDRFNNTTISLSTANNTGSYNNGFSGFTSTAVILNANETFGVQISTVPNTGVLPQGLKVHFDMWIRGRY